MRRTGLVVGWVIWMWLASVASADGDCNRPGNLTFNCNLDRFSDHSQGDSTRWLPDGWTAWVVMGNPAFQVDDHGSAPGQPAQWIWSDGGTWTAGLYQQVAVTPGKGYVAHIDWCPVTQPGISVERRLGIDPLGGTDPLSPSIVWGPSTWSNTEKMPDLRVSAYAQGPTVTVYVWTHNPASHGQDGVFLDAVTLLEDPTMVPPTATPEPTSTSVPPTATPPPVAATPTSTPSHLPPTPTLTPTQAPTQTPTPTATVQPSSTPAPSPTDTPSPTMTPTRTAVSVGIVYSTPQPRQPGVRESVGTRSGTPVSVFLLVAVGAVSVALLLGLAIVALWTVEKLGRGRV
jgi:hypothetical protein